MYFDGLKCNGSQSFPGNKIPVIIDGSKQPHHSIQNSVYAHSAVQNPFGIHSSLLSDIWDDYEGANLYYSGVLIAENIDGVVNQNLYEWSAWENEFSVSAIAIQHCSVRYHSIETTETGKHTYYIFHASEHKTAKYKNSAPMYKPHSTSRRRVNGTHFPPAVSRLVVSSTGKHRHVGITNCT